MRSCELAFTMSGLSPHDDAQLYVARRDGATGMFITTTGEAPGTNRFEVSGTKGKLLCENKELWFFKNDADTKELIETSSEGFKKPNCEKILVETDGENPQHAGIINNFTATLLGKEELFVSGTDGTRTYLRLESPLHGTRWSQRLHSY